MQINFVPLAVVPLANRPRRGTKPAFRTGREAALDPIPGRSEATADVPSLSRAFVR